ncbi:MAG: hypothetical protein ACLUL2_18865 [Blautia sp.]
MLAEVKGIGKTDVFVTFEDTGERVVEKDGTDTVYSKDSKGNQEPYLSNERYPKISGVVVVAEGGEDPHVIQNIQEAVQALFQVEAHKIASNENELEENVHEKNLRGKNQVIITAPGNR